jgi:hypothetical protein
MHQRARHSRTHRLAAASIRIAAASTPLDRQWTADGKIFSMILLAAIRNGPFEFADSDAPAADGLYRFA